MGLTKEAVFRLVCVCVCRVYKLQWDRYRYPITGVKGTDSDSTRSTQSLYGTKSGRWTRGHRTSQELRTRLDRRRDGSDGGVTVETGRTHAGVSRKMDLVGEGKKTGKSDGTKEGPGRSGLNNEGPETRVHEQREKWAWDV